VLERFWGVREAAAEAGFLERLLCQGLLGRLAGCFFVWDWGDGGITLIVGWPCLCCGMGSRVEGGSCERMV
jgi:hypothetical protein